MRSEFFIRILAGTVVLLGLALARWVGPWWLLLDVFVALNLIQSAFTGFCPPTLLLHKIGWLHPDGFVRFRIKKTA